MAIQVVPILKALAPVISTAGSMYADWQRGKRGSPPAEGAAGERLDDIARRLGALEAASAENSHLIAQLAEQLRETALQLEQVSREAEAARARQARYLLVGLLAALVSVGAAVTALLA